MSISVFVVAASIALAQVSGPPTPPKANTVREIHGRQLADEYSWMRDRDDPRVLAHLRAENAYTEEMMAGTEGLQKKLYAEMLGRIKQTDETVPYREGGYVYYSRTEEGKGYRTHCRRKDAPGAAEEVILDVNALSAGKPFLSAFPLSVSPDGNVLAYGEDLTGGRRFTVHFKDMGTGKGVGRPIENCQPGVAWAADSETFFYTTLDHAVRADKAWRGRLGRLGHAGEPYLVHHETDERYVADVAESSSGQYVLLSLGSMKTTEVWFLDAAKPDGSFQVIEPRREGVEYSTDHHGASLYILHNDGALNFELARAPLGSPARANWEPVIRQDAGTYLEWAQCFTGHLVVAQRSAGLQQLRIRDLRDNAEHVVSMPDAAYALRPGTNEEFATTTLRFEYSSPVTPPSTFDYDMAARQRTLLKEQPVPTYDRTRYTVERVQAAATDGELVPVTLTYLKGIKKDGSNPCFLYSYGSYGSSSDPGFRQHLVSFLDRGFVCAVAHIRGGSEKGRAWYENGRMMHKKNTFTDFIAAAEFLVKDGYTSPERLAIRGGSAGGLLMGAVVNMRPDLFGVCVADVPFVDVINTMLDPGLPLTVTEFEQWGNPAEAEAFAYMVSYSPYDNVGAKNYPDILATTAWNDSQVCYWEPAKWVARLRDRKTGDGTVLLKTNLDSGHGGASDRYQALEEEAFRYAFVLNRLGIKE